MKLRQKLAMVLAAATVVTAVPVVTFAASSNTIVNKQVGKKDRTYGYDGTTDLATGPLLKIKLEDDLDVTEAPGKGLFYLEFEGFELDKNQYDRDNEIFTNVKMAQGDTSVDATGKNRPFGDLTVEFNKKILRVDLRGYEDVYGTPVIPDGTVLYIPLFGKVTGDTAIVKIDNNQLEITEGSALTFAESKDNKCTVTAENLTNIFDEGIIGDILFSEPYENVVKGKYDDGKYVTFGGVQCFEVKLTTDNQEFEFLDNQRALKVEFGKGFNYSATVPTDFIVTSKYGDEVKIYIPVTAFQQSGKWTDTKGIFRIKGIEMRANTKTPTAGPLTINVKGELGEATALKVADIVLTDTKIYMKDEKTLDIVAGRSKEDAVFFLEENVKDGILPNHTVDFELSKGAYFGTYDEAKYGNIKSATRTQKVASAKEIIKAKAANVEIVDVEMDGTKFIGFTAKFVAEDLNDDGDYTDHTDINAAPLDSKDKYEFEAPICVDLDVADGTEIKLSASGERAIDEEVSCIAAKIIAPIKIEAEPMVVKVGLQDQLYKGKITITETANDRIKRGDIVISTPAEGYKFTEKGEVKVTSGDLVIKDWEIKNDCIVIEVKNASKTASTIEITGFEVELNRIVPEGTYKLEFAGSALTDIHDFDGYHTHGSISVKDFFKVNTRNTEDIKQGALKAVVATFTADSAEYTVDGVAKSMDAKAYIQDGRIMVPARYVAEAFGIQQDNILFADGVATIISGEKIIQLKAGSDIITVNGAAIKMDTKAVIKDGRTYLPMKFIAAALGVQVTFDSATKTATFDNRDAK